MPTTAPATVGRFMELLRPMMRSRSTVRSQVISFDSTDFAFLIPISGNLQGNGGTYFRSDLFIRNDASTDQRIGVAYLAAGTANSGNAIAFYNVPAKGGIVFYDFVGSALGRSGLGAIIISGVDSNGNPDSSATIDGFSRIWTPQPGSTGTVSQNFDAISVVDLLGSDPASIIGLRQNSAFRSNVGIVNLDSSPHTWNVFAATGVSQQITVPANSVVQTGVVPGAGSAQSGAVALTLVGDSSTFFWSAYGTSNDNVTGDGWVSRAKQ